MPSNTAAYLVPTPTKHLEIKEAPYTKPGPNQIVIRNHAVAINPVDWMLPIFGGFGWIKWPFILGYDVAGEVVEIGSQVSRFNIGDRVLGQAVGADEIINNSTQSGFQLYTVLLEYMACRMPQSVSYEAASVVPLGASTAACGLFQKDKLNLQLPTIPPKPAGKTLLIWGGSTSVGCNAIQLAAAAGYEVFTTCSPRNFDFCKSLGASQCFDYNSPTVEADIIKAFEGKTTAGALTMGQGAAEAAFNILHHCTGNKFIAMASYPAPANPPKHLVIPQTIFHFASWMIAATAKSKLRGIKFKLIDGTTLVHDGVGKAIYTDFLGQALEKGVYQCKPDAMVVGHGLEKLQDAFDVQKKGVSAKKVVLTL
jgi:NADPH:quinone reductase-like Zn-dependent oxidoreductase